MKEVFKQIENLKTEFNALQPIAEEHNDELWEKFRLEWNYNSNHIEGNTLTYGDTKLLFRLGDNFKPQNNSLKDVNEMRAHDVAIHLIRKWADEKNRKLTEKDIRELNEIILVKDFWADAQTADGQPTRRRIKVGQYKEMPNHVILKSGAIFKYAEPKDVPFKMRELLDWYEGQKDEDPLIVAAYLHYKFVIIHPFDDGNGRVSRLLMNYHLMKNGYLPLIIKSKDKPNYLYALNQADTGNVNAFIEYLGKQLIWSFDLGIKAAKGESISETDDLYKEIEVWKKRLKSGFSSAPKRTDERVMEVYDNSIVGIFDLIKEKASTFNELFRTNSNLIEHKIHNKDFTKSSKIYLGGYRTMSTDSLDKIRLMVKLISPQYKPDSKEKVTLEVIANFNAFNYSFSIDDIRQEKQYNYNYFLTDEEKHEVADNALEQLFKKVKEVTT